MFFVKVSNQLPSQPARILPNFCLADSLTNLITRQNPGLWLDKGCPFEGCAPYDLVITGILLEKYWRYGGQGDAETAKVGEAVDVFIGPKLLYLLMFLLD
jgi:hypothetical protein